MKKLCTLVVMVSFFLSLPALAKRYTYGFKLSKLHMALEGRAEWDVDITDETLKALNQPYFFLGKGAQSYAFLSRDGQYVIKFFRQIKSDTNPRNACVLQAAMVAYDRFKEETGLFYVHLNQTENILPVICIRDAVGRRLRVALDQYRFAVQKKVDSLESTLKDAKKRPKEMKARLDQLIEIVSKRAAKGIKNKDPNLMRNTGFLKDCAIEVDFGSYKEEPDLNVQQELKWGTGQLRRWLFVHAPEWVTYLDAQMARQ